MAMEAAAQFIKEYVNQVVEKEQQDAARETLGKLAGDEALGRLQPRRNTLTRIKAIFTKLDGGAHAELWGEFLSDHKTFNEVIGAQWLQIIADAHEEQKVPQAAAPAAENKEYEAPVGRHVQRPFVTPKLQLEVPQWDSAQGTCGDWIDRATPVLKELGLPKSHWYTVLHQRIEGSGQADLEDVRRSDPEGDIMSWLKKLTEMYDVNAEAKLAARFKAISLETSFSALRIELQQVARRLNAYDGWDLTERALVVWAGLAMNQQHWAILQRESPKTLAEMQQLVYRLRLEEPIDPGINGSNMGAAMSVGRSRVDDRAICRKFQEGRCSFGEKCHYYHPTELCKDFANKQCRRANCRFLHQTPQRQQPTTAVSQKGVGPCFHCQGAHLRRDCEEYIKFKSRMGSANAIHRFNDDEGDLNELLARLGLERSKSPSVYSCAAVREIVESNPDDDFGPATRVGRVY
jgi:hypothetical protein